MIENVNAGSRHHCSDHEMVEFDRYRYLMEGVKKTEPGSSGGAQ